MSHYTLCHLQSLITSLCWSQNNSKLQLATRNNYNSNYSNACVYTKQTLQNYNNSDETQDVVTVFQFK